MAARLTIDQVTAIAAAVSEYVNSPILTKSVRLRCIYNTTQELIPIIIKALESTDDLPPTTPSDPKPSSAFD